MKRFMRPRRRHLKNASLVDDFADDVVGQVDKVTPNSAVGAVQDALQKQADITGKALNRWLMSSKAANHPEYGRFVRAYQKYADTNFGKMIRGRFLDRRMNYLLKKGRIPGAKAFTSIDRVIPGVSGKLRPDLYFRSLGGESVIFDFGGPSKIGQMGKYTGMADELIPIIPSSF